MRTWFSFFALALLLAGCASLSNPDSPVGGPSSPLATASPPAPTLPPLELSIDPAPDQSFGGVVGRAPFTVTINLTIHGGVAPVSVVTLQAESADHARLRPSEAGSSFVLPSGIYTITAEVRDGAGQFERAERRIVALGEATPPTAPGWKYGVTARLQDGRAGYYPTRADVTRAAETMQSAGLQAVRVWFDPDRLNPAPGQWQFEDYDAVVQAARSHGLGVLAVLGYSSWWGSSAQTSNDWRVRLYSPPRDPRDFARFAYAVVSRYRDQVRAWQVWDKPNVAQYWQPAPDAAGYVRLLKETYPAIKYADPHALVVFGGLSGNGVEGDDASGWASGFIQSAYAAGARGYFDVMAIHPYILPNSGINTVRDRIAAAHAVLNRNGNVQVPIWLTELGAPTDAPWWPTAPIQSEANQANWLEQVYTRLWDLTPTIFWYELKDRAGDDSADAHFGLLRADFSSKPAYDRLKALTGGK